MSRSIEHAIKKLTDAHSGALTQRGGRHGQGKEYKYNVGRSKLETFTNKEYLRYCNVDFPDGTRNVYKGIDKWQKRNPEKWNDRHLLSNLHAVDKKDANTTAFGSEEFKKLQNATGPDRNPHEDAIGGTHVTPIGEYTQQFRFTLNGEIIKPNWKNWAGNSVCSVVDEQYERFFLQRDTDTKHVYYIERDGEKTDFQSVCGIGFFTMKGLSGKDYSEAYDGTDWMSLNKPTHGPPGVAIELICRVEKGGYALNRKERVHKHDHYKGLGTYIIMKILLDIYKYYNKNLERAEDEMPPVWLYNAGGKRAWEIYSHWGFKRVKDPRIIQGQYETELKKIKDYKKVRFAYEELGNEHYSTPPGTAHWRDVLTVEAINQKGLYDGHMVLLDDKFEHPSALRDALVKQSYADFDWTPDEDWLRPGTSGTKRKSETPKNSKLRKSSSKRRKSSSKRRKSSSKRRKRTKSRTSRKK